MIRILFPLFFAFALIAQNPTADGRLSRIEENTATLKDSLKATDKHLENIDSQLRSLQDKVVAVESQNRIILAIAAAAFAVGLSFLVFVWKKFEALLSQRPVPEGFTPDDRLLLAKIYDSLKKEKPNATGASGA